MTCPLCNDTGEQRYWEGRWRDEKADNERLRADLATFGKETVATENRIIDAEFKATELQHENERLRAALKPFAKAAECAENDEADSYGLEGSSARHELTLGDLRRAAAAYQQPLPSVNWKDGKPYAYCPECGRTQPINQQNAHSEKP